MEGTTGRGEGREMVEEKKGREEWQARRVVNQGRKEGEGREKGKNDGK